MISIWKPRNILYFLIIRESINITIYLCSTPIDVKSCWVTEKKVWAWCVSSRFIRSLGLKCFPKNPALLSSSTNIYYYKWSTYYVLYSHFSFTHSHTDHMITAAAKQGARLRRNLGFSPVDKFTPVPDPLHPPDLSHCPLAQWDRGGWPWLSGRKRGWQ